MDAAAQALIERAREARAAADDVQLDRLARELVDLGTSLGDDEVVAWGNYNLGIAQRLRTSGVPAGTSMRQKP